MIVAGGFRLAFAWTGDRWSHEIEHAGPRDPRPLARSFEAAVDGFEAARIVSPAFQQINFQEAAGGNVQALLVGQAGPHHFSAVFDVEERAARGDGDGEPGLVRVKVEVADRCRFPVEFLASTYRVAADSGDLSGEMLVGGPPEMAWDFGPNRLEFVAPPPAQVAFSEDGRRGTRVQAVAGPAASPPPGPGSAATTHRWTYYWQWLPDIRRSPR